MVIDNVLLLQKKKKKKLERGVVLGVEVKGSSWGFQVELVYLVN
jgi:hypothetical protein